LLPSAQNIILYVKTTGDVTMTHKDYAGAVKSREPLFKPDEAGEYVGFTAGWLAKLRMKGSSGPKFIKLGRKVRYSRSDLDAWVAAGHSASTSEHKPE